jgi:hypothetical protein
MNTCHRALAALGQTSPLKQDADASAAAATEAAAAAAHEAVVQRKYLPHHLAAQPVVGDTTAVAPGSSGGGGVGNGADEKCPGEGGMQGMQGELIVVASLIDKMPNLAGIARTCEVLSLSIPPSPLCLSLSLPLLSVSLSPSLSLL